MRRFSFSLVFGLLFLLGCNRHETADYFPLRPGAQRLMKVYTRMVAGRDTTETTQVRVVEIVRGENEVPDLGKVWVVEMPRDSGRPDTIFLRRHEDGIIQLVRSGDKQPPTELLYLSLPLAKGLKWYDTKSQNEMMEVTAQESVKVEAGTYPDCYEVVVRNVRTGGTLNQWFAPNVGVVKSENQAVWTSGDGVRRELFQRAELVAYQLPGGSTKTR